jgi:AraC-like DNA-binding protein
MTVIDSGRDADNSDLWRTELSSAFAGLLPEGVDDRPTRGTIVAASLGAVRTFRVSGSPQIVRENELQINPGQLAVYDTGSAYDLLLEGDWECAVMAFPPSSLHLPRRWIDDVMRHVHDASSGAGTVLASFIHASLTTGESDRTGSRLRFADAGMQLLCSALTETPPAPSKDNAAEALRLTVLDYVRRNLHDMELSHNTVAAAHGLSTRTLDRLFEHEQTPVAASIRDWRLEGARRELLDVRARRVTIGAIAARWCFADAAHFSRLYKRHFGSSPSSDRDELE